MKQAHFTFKDPEGIEIFVYKWLPDVDPKAVVQVAHGMAETAERYERLAGVLTEQGYIVYANDHRGHGKTAGGIDNIGYIGQNGFTWLIHNMKQLNEIIATENPGLPIFLLGHSMGSFLTQYYIGKHGNNLRGTILSGTNGKNGPILNVGILIARCQMMINGAKAKSPLLNNMSFGSYNKNFQPARTIFDWLSRDAAEVDKYINNPYCGAIFTTSFFHDLAVFLKGLQDKDILNGIPKSMPLYIMSGDSDPVGNSGKGPAQMAEIYKEQGLSDVTLKLYPGGRHEMLNEINRDEVMEDILNWLNKHM